MMKTIKVITAILLNVLVGALGATCMGIDPIYGAIAAPVIATLAGGFMPQGALLAGVLTEVWTGELVKRLGFGMRANFLDGIPDYSRYVENDVIHLVGQGVDPDVLINNTQYPLDLKILDDDDLTFSLDKYQTTPTPVTDDELYALSYDKMTVVRDKHSDVLIQTRYKRALYSLSPATHATKTPVVFTSGAGNEEGYKSLTKTDIIKLKNRFDRMKVPMEGRRLVLCTQHIKDLLVMDQKFADQYYNYTSGKIANLYGFHVYEYADCPYYTKEGVRLLFSATPAGTDRQASIAFFAPRVFLANGTTKMYYQEAEGDPLNQRNIVSFRNYFVCVPKMAEAYAAIVSADSGATPGSIVATPASVSFLAAGEEKDVTVTASGDWGVSGTVAGFSAVKTDENTVTITATENTDTSKGRAGKFVVALDDDNTVTADIDVSQPAAVVGEDYITVIPASLEFAAVGESKEVAVTASGDWDVSGVVEGFTAAKKGDDSGVTIVATENVETTPRSGLFTVELDGDSSVTAIIAVTQLGGS